MVEWDRGLEPDLDHYNIWYSLTPGQAKTLLAAISHDPGAIEAPAYDAGSGRTAYVDFPRVQQPGTECYQISAVDTADNESDRTAEVCLPNDPPPAVEDFTVELGGGSGEVFLTWKRVLAPDMDHYDIWYSELPGEPKSLLDSVANDPAILDAPAYDVGGGVTGYIDFPRNLTANTQCYQITAVDAAGLESERTPQRCLTSGL